MSLQIKIPSNGSFSLSSATYSALLIFPARTKKAQDSILFFLLISTIAFFSAVVLYLGSLKSLSSSSWTFLFCGSALYSDARMFFLPKSMYHKAVLSALLYFCNMSPYCLYSTFAIFSTSILSLDMSLSHNGSPNLLIKSQSKLFSKSNLS